MRINRKFRKFRIQRFNSPVRCGAMNNIHITRFDEGKLFWIVNKSILWLSEKFEKRDNGVLREKNKIWMRIRCLFTIGALANEART